MLHRRSLLLSLLAAPLPLTAAVAQPWWDEHARHKEWQHYEEEERRRREARHQAWDEQREHAAWEHREREEAEREWEHEHHEHH